MSSFGKPNVRRDSNLFLNTCWYLVGGLLICLPRDKAQSYCSELQSLDGEPAWIVGEVVSGNRQAKMQTDLKIIEV